MHEGRIQYWSFVVSCSLVYFLSSPFFVARILVPQQSKEQAKHTAYISDIVQVE